jgi:hypothetical protein
MRPAGLVFFTLASFVLSYAAKADEDLVAKREACRTEAKERIAPRSNTGTDAYRRIVERRNTYVAQCMAKPRMAKPAAKSKEAPPKPVKRRSR